MALCDISGSMSQYSRMVLHFLHAVANQLGAAAVNSLATSIGAPTSTTQVVTATLLGNGAAEKPGPRKSLTA